MKGSRSFWLSLLILLAAWEAYVHLSRIGTFFLVPPSAVAVRLGQWLLSGRLLEDAGASIVLLLLGLGLAAAVAIPAGFGLGLWGRSGDVFGPYLVLAYATPAVVFVPLLLMWFGFTYPSRVLIVAVFATLPMLLNVWWGVRSLDSSWLRVARAFGANQREVLLQIFLPGSVGHVLSSLRIGGGMALIGVFVAEFYGADRGVGYLSIIGSKRMDVAGILAGLILLGLLGIALEQGLATAERKLAPWRSAQ